MSQATDRDHQGAIIWVECPMCGADRKVECTAIQMLGMLLPPGKIHELRLRKWMELKARAVAWCNSMRFPNIQQIPRTKGDL